MVLIEVPYSSTPDLTRYNVDVQRSYGPGGWARYNDLITALAGGTEAVWETPTGAAFIVPLTGSALCSDADRRYALRPTARNGP
jgi:hypothetical protein